MGETVTGVLESMAVGDILYFLGETKRGKGTTKKKAKKIKVTKRKKTNSRKRK
jgi:hypothetical protein